jgi:hypothetical protein
MIFDRLHRAVDRFGLWEVAVTPELRATRTLPVVGRSKLARLRRPLRRFTRRNSFGGLSGCGNRLAVQFLGEVQQHLGRRNASCKKATQSRPMFSINLWLVLALFVCGCYVQRKRTNHFDFIESVRCSVFSKYVMEPNGGLGKNIGSLP